MWTGRSAGGTESAGGPNLSGHYWTASKLPVNVKIEPVGRVVLHGDLCRLSLRRIWIALHGRIKIILEPQAAFRGVETIFEPVAGIPSVFQSGTILLGVFQTGCAWGNPHIAQSLLLISFKFFLLALGFCRSLPVLFFNDGFLR